MLHVPCAAMADGIVPGGIGQLAAALAGGSLLKQKFTSVDAEGRPEYKHL